MKQHAERYMKVWMIVSRAALEESFFFPFRMATSVTRIGLSGIELMLAADDRGREMHVKFEDLQT